MRKYDNILKDYLNNEIGKNPNLWRYSKGANFGIRLQELVGKFYIDNQVNFGINNVIINTNPNCTDHDVVIFYNNGNVDGIEVKSCKDGSLGGVTICNSPELINDKDAILINYTIENSTVHIIDVIRTQIFRLITINSNGKYRGCLSSTRDTGKKIKGRNYNQFINSNDNDDYTLEELTNPALIRRTVLFYSASKLVDDNYNFTDEEILQAVNALR